MQLQLQLLIGGMFAGVSCPFLLNNPHTTPAAVLHQSSINVVLCCPPQDVSIEGGQLAPDQSRHSVRGITVELVRRNPQTGGWAAASSAP